MQSLFEYKLNYSYEFITENYNEFEWDLTNDNNLYKQLKELVSKNYNTAINFLKKLLKKLLKFKKIKILKRVILIGAIIFSVNTVENMFFDIEESGKITDIVKTDISNYFEQLKRKGNISDINKDYEFNLYNAPETYSEDLLNLMKEEEGYRNTAYDIGDGMITIGYGHAEKIATTNMVAGETVISKKQAEEFLKEDLKSAKNGLNRLLNRWKKEGVRYNITQGMYDSMISLIYNAGIGNFLKSEFIQLVKDGKYDEAAEKLKTTYVSYPGHVKRRLRESDLFLKK